MATTKRQRLSSLGDEWPSASTSSRSCRTRTKRWLHARLGTSMVIWTFLPLTALVLWQLQHHTLDWAVFKCEISRDEVVVGLHDTGVLDLPIRRNGVQIHLFEEQSCSIAHVEQYLTARPCALVKYYVHVKIAYLGSVNFGESWINMSTQVTLSWAWFLLCQALERILGSGEVSFTLTNIGWSF